MSQRITRYFRVQYPDIYFAHNVVINANALWALVNKRDNTGGAGATYPAGMLSWRQKEQSSCCTF